MLTGDDLEIFVDRAGIKWGDEWRARIEAALQQTTFFIPVVTPRFLKSEECRRELISFSGAARSLGVEDLLMPLLYVPVDIDEDSPDEVIRLIARTQYEDWRALRFADVGSAEHRLGVNRLALRLVEIDERVATQPTLSGISLLTPAGAEKPAAGASIVDEPATVADLEAPGLIDLLAEFENLSPIWIETINQFPAVMAEVGSLTEAATERLAQGDREGKGFAFRVLVAHDLAAQLQEPAAQLEALSTDYASQLIDIDPGVQALIRLALEADETNPDHQQAARELSASILDLVEKSRATSVALTEFIAILSDSARSSRELRPVMNRMQTALRAVVDGQLVIEQWERLLIGGDASGG
jgi:hypothetical protein